jgi:hypothetical protein
MSSATFNAIHRSQTLRQTPSVDELIVFAIPP